MKLALLGTTRIIYSVFVRIMHDFICITPTRGINGSESVKWIFTFWHGNEQYVGLLVYDSVSYNIPLFWPVSVKLLCSLPKIQGRLAGVAL